MRIQTTLYVDEDTGNIVLDIEPVAAIRAEVEECGLTYNPKYTYIPVYANDYDGDLEGFAVLDEDGKQINDL